MVCLYRVAIKPGNHAGDSRFISAARCQAVLDENPKPQKNCHLSDRQVLTPAPLVTPDPSPEFRLISEGTAKTIDQRRTNVA